MPTLHYNGAVFKYVAFRIQLMCMQQSSRMIYTWLDRDYHTYGEKVAIFSLVTIPIEPVHNQLQEARILDGLIISAVDSHCLVLCLLT